MIGGFQRVLLGLTLAAVATGAAAGDYLVVRSSDPAFPRGQALSAGARVALAAGGTLTLMHASGDVVTLKGAAGGVSLPPRAASTPDAERMAVLKFILARAPRDDAARPTRTRSGICPSVEAITTLDAITQVQQGGCADEAAQALEAFLAARLEP